MFKLITCIASEDHAKDAVSGLFEVYGIHAMVSHFSRGFGRSSPLATQKVGQQTEKVIISIVVNRKQADEIFAYVYNTAELGRPHGEIIYVTAIGSAIISPSVNLMALKHDVDSSEGETIKGAHLA